MSFSGIPTRTNGTKILRAWFNDLKTAGSNLESGIVVSNTFTIANNQSSAASVTSAILSSASYTSAQIYAELKRGSTVQIVMIYMYYDGTNWNVEYTGLAGSDAGVTFTIDSSTGQLKYTSTNTSAGTMKWLFMNKLAV